MFEVHYKVGKIVNNALVYEETTEWAKSSELNLTEKKVKGILVDAVRVIRMDTTTRPVVKGTVVNRPALRWTAEEEDFKSYFKGSKYYDQYIKPEIEKAFTRVREDRELLECGGFVPATPRELLYEFYRWYQVEFANEPRTLAVLSRFKLNSNFNGVFTLRHRL